MALATGTNTTFLDTLYLQLAKQLDSRGDIVTVIVMEVVDSVSGILPAYISHERWPEN